jgi:hypothetical protein
MRLFAILFLLGTIAPANAQTTPLHVVIVATDKTAPVTLLACNHRGVANLEIKVANRSVHPLTSITYKMHGYSSQAVQFPDTPLKPTIPLDPGESGIFTTFVLASPSEHTVACAITGAQFARGPAWSASRPWKGALVPIKQLAGTENSEKLGSSSTGTKETGKGVSVAIIGHWTTPQNGQTYIHVRTTFRASRDVTVSASQFHALIPLSLGGEKSVPAIGYPVPGTSKLGLTTTPPPLVAPTEDFGAIGQMHLRAGESASITITFVVTSTIDDNSLSHLSTIWEPSGM